jgi:hypothetical protein
MFLYLILSITLALSFTILVNPNLALVVVNI